MLERLERVSLAGRLPEPRTECETDLFDALTIMFLSPRDSARARAAVRAAVGDGTFELLVAYLAFIRTAHYWTEMHPELTYEPDMADILRGYGELADLLLDKSEAELVQGGVRLRETLSQLKRVEGALQQSESRHAFLLRLGDAVRLLVIRWRFKKRRAGFSASGCSRRPCLLRRTSDEAQGQSWPNGLFAARSRVWSDISAGRPVVVDRHADLAVDSRWGTCGGCRDERGAFVAAPLMRHGRLVAALFVNDFHRGHWTAEEVELVRETAERTWEAIERARAEELLRDADMRKDEFMAMLAHELRNPLAPIRTGLELIRRGGDTMVAVERVRAMMERQVGHMVRLVDDLMDVSRITSGKIVLQRAHTAGGSGPQRGGNQSRCNGGQTNRIERGVAGRLRHRCRSDTVRSDPVKPAPQRGEIHQPCRFGGHLRPRSLSRQAMTVAHLSISWSIQVSGFRRNYSLECSTSSRKGRCGSSKQDWASASRSRDGWWNFTRGRLDARSEGHGRGSEFTILLPLATTRSVSATERRADEDRLERRVLVIDDNQDAANTTAMLVEDMGGDARVAYDGESALAMLEEYTTRSDPSGHRDARARRVRDLSTDTSCAGQPCSAGGVDRVRPGAGQGEGERAGFDAHLTKPADGAALAGIFGVSSSQMTRATAAARVLSSTRRAGGQHVRYPVGVPSNAHAYGLPAREPPGDWNHHYQPVDRVPRGGPRGGAGRRST